MGDGAETAEKKKLEENTGRILLANSSQLETVAPDAALADGDEVLVEPVASKKSESCVPRIEHDHNVIQWKEGVQLPTSDPNSEDNVRVQKSLAYNLFIPHLEGNEPNQPFLPLSQQVEILKRGQETKGKDPAEGIITESSPTQTASSAARSVFQQSSTAEKEIGQQDAKRQDQAVDVVGNPTENRTTSKGLEESKPGSSSRTTSGCTTFEGISREAAKKLAPLRSVPNLTKPDFSWIAKTPVTFKSSSATSFKGNGTLPGSIKIPRDNSEEASETTKATEHAFGCMKLDFNQATKGATQLISSSSSSSSESPRQTPSATSREDSPMEAKIFAKYPKNLPEPEMPLQGHYRAQPTTRAWNRGENSSDEDEHAKVQQLRARAEAAILKRQIEQAFWVHRSRKIQEKSAPKAEKEPEDVRKEASALKTSGRKTQRQAARAQRGTMMASSATTTEKARNASKADVPSPMVLNIEHQTHQMENLADDEFTVQTGPTNRQKRAQAFKQSQVKKMEEQAATEELTKIEEERRLAEKAAAPVLSVAAKRRSRAKRNAEGKSWADVARR